MFILALIPVLNTGTRFGVSAEYEIGRLLLEAKSLEFGEGTSELHTKLIAEYALGIRKQ